MGWRKEVIALGGVTGPVDVKPVGEVLRLEVSQCPDIGTRFHLDGAGWIIRSVKDMGARGERWACEAVPAAGSASAEPSSRVDAEPETAADTPAAAPAPRRARRKGGEA